MMTPGVPHLKIDMGTLGSAQLPADLDLATARNLEKGIQGLYQDVAGYEDDYLRCSIFCWRLSGNSAETLSIIASLGTSVLSGLSAASGLFDSNTTEILSIIAMCTSITSAGLIGLKKHSKKAIIDRRQQLRQVLRDHGIDIPENDDEDQKTDES